MKPSNLHPALTSAASVPAVQVRLARLSFILTMTTTLLMAALTD